MLYRINEDNCLTALAAQGVDKDWCAHSLTASHNRRPIKIGFGQIYEMDDGRFYIQFVMNEQNLLESIKSRIL